MNKPGSTGNSGGRRQAASQALPLSYRRVPVADLRRLPIRDNPRLVVLDYRLTNAPGMNRAPRTHGHGAARLAGSFTFALCVTKDSTGEWYMEVQPSPYDDVQDKRHPLDVSPQILADIYRAVQRKQIAAEGRLNGQGRGKN